MNPQIINCPADQFTLVASNVMNGKIDCNRNGSSYFATYRLTGNPAPTSTEDSIEIFKESSSVGIGNTVAIDVYIYCKDNDGEVIVSV